MNNIEKLNAWFKRLDQKLTEGVAPIVAETAVEYFKESFTTKSFNGKAWQKTKRPNPKGSLMVRSGKLVNSIRPAKVDSNRVVISAGSSRVPYARIHNEGGAITQAARTETFVRNRYTRGARGKMFGGMGAFKRGTTPGQGYTFKERSIKIPARPFMGGSAILNKRIITRIKAYLKTV